jgi:glycosyltransferase involved in cell wall biosynthesis
MKKNIYIISADDIILYQPTILNLYDSLKVEFNTQIITFKPEFLGSKKDEERNVTYIHHQTITSKTLRFIELIFNAIFKRLNRVSTFFSYRLQLIRWYKSKLLYKQIRLLKNEKIIAVDPMPLYVAQKTKNDIYFLSLEIIPKDKYLSKIRPAEIKCVIIQNKERFDFLFPSFKPEVFYIQNSPKKALKYLPQEQRNNLLWAGTITKEFGILHCVEFVKKHKQYKLILKGASAKNTKEYIEEKYQDLILSKNLEINTSYYDAKNFIQFIAQHKIGFCFYNWDLIHSNFNYQTAPSGKLFMYLAAGVPVIACNIVGFKFINTFKAGILINDYEPETILKAIQIIEQDYETYVSNAYKAFDATCFDIHIGSFKNYLLQ